MHRMILKRFIISRNVSIFILLSLALWDKVILFGNVAARRKNNALDGCAGDVRFAWKRSRPKVRGNLIKNIHDYKEVKSGHRKSIIRSA